MSAVKQSVSIFFKFLFQTHSNFSINRNVGCSDVDHEKCTKNVFSAMEMRCS